MIYDLELINILPLRKTGFLVKNTSALSQFLSKDEILFESSKFTTRISTQ